jgi:glycerophosphoryl diester phosphodiesterase
VIGHRGARSQAPENTLASLQAAVTAGVDIVEFDISPGLFLAHSAREVPPEAIDLHEALDYLKAHEVGVHLDVKLPGYEADVVAAVREHGLEQRAIVSSAWAATSRAVARLAPELPRAIGYPHDRYGASRVPWPPRLTQAGAASLRACMPLRIPLLLRRAQANVLALHHALCSRAAIAAAHRKGAPVLAWTVNDADTASRLARAGIDGIVSDDPAMVLATLTAP